MTGVFIAVAVLLVAFGGLLAAADAAMAVLSCADSTELAEGSRVRRSLLAIAVDVPSHVNAVNFLRVTSETTAAVLAARARLLIDQWWWSC
ncbi:MAG: hypothetical protein R2717_07685 [Schumannella sp.]